MTVGRAELERLDREDPLATFRDRFVLPPGTIYLDGNSLGPMPVAAVARAHQVVEAEWGEGLIGSWNDAGWYALPVRLGEKIARIIGADPSEVVVTDSTSINLYKALSMALRLRPERRVVVMERDGFPSNAYVVQGLLQQLGEGYSIRLSEAERLPAALDAHVAAVCLTEVHYQTGALVDMARLTAAAHEHGALAVWDLCHSAGALPLEVRRCQVDFAVGCTYKYLNGGPGSPAFLFGAARHHGAAVQPLTGWWGHAAPFAFEPDSRPAGGMRQMLTGTPPVVSLALAEVGIDIVLAADIALIRDKSMRMTDLFVRLTEEHCAGFGLRLTSPREAEHRGSQVSFVHEHGYAVMQALIARGVIGDYREPDTMRFGMAPLYLRYVDLWDAVQTLRDVLETEAWRADWFRRRRAVT